MIYYVYFLNEDRSKTNLPYVGCTKDPIRRAKEHRRRLHLDYVPDLEIIKEFTNKKEARSYENDLREANGWQREGYADCAKIGKMYGRIGGKISGRKAVESGHINNLGKVWGKIMGERHKRSGHIQKLGKAQATYLSNLPNHPNKQKVVCPHCGKYGGMMPLKRWHFDNCKKNINKEDE
jgi:predicted GIY-YIG superfamily endonuclease